MATTLHATIEHATHTTSRATVRRHAVLVDRYFDLIRHVHINEMDGRHPGTGFYDFKPVLQVLARRGYAGWLSLEVFDFSAGADPEEMLCVRPRGSALLRGFALARRDHRFVKLVACIAHDEIWPSLSGCRRRSRTVRRSQEQPFRRMGPIGSGRA